jgi:hypothetical protein
MAACGALPGVVLLRLLVAHLYTRSGQPVRVGVPGTPDLLVMVDGKAIGIELKTPLGRLSPEQVACHAAWLRQGTPVVVCRSVDEVRQAIEARRQCTTDDFIDALRERFDGSNWQTVGPLIRRANGGER